MHSTSHELSANPSRHTPWVLVLLVPLVQVLVILWVIWTRTPHVPFWDEWETVLLVHKAAQGTLQLGDFFVFHNEHRVVIPTMLELLMIEITHWNRQIEMTANLGVAMATAGLLFWCARRALGSGRVLYLLIAPLSLLYFSFSEYENWTWAFQLTFLMTVFGAVLCLWVLTRNQRSWRVLGIAALGALIASLSALPGLVVWVAFLPVIVRFGYRKTAAWLAGAVVVWILYFIGFPEQAHAPVRIADAVNYALIYLGAPLGYPVLSSSTILTTLGIALLCIHVRLYWLSRRDIDQLLPWIGVVLFSFGCAVVTAYGRVHFGIEQALAPRYHAFSVLWWIALVIVIAMTIQEVWTSRTRGHLSKEMGTSIVAGIMRLDTVAVAILCLVLLEVNFFGLIGLTTWQVGQLRNERCVLHYRMTSDSCLALYCPYPGVRIRAALLQLDHMSIFSTP